MNIQVNIMAGTGTLVPVSALTPAVLQEIIKRIVDAVDPEKIILFGSYAYGTPHPDSDVDILVILTTDLPRHKRPAVIHRALAGLLIPKDILVYTPAEVDEWKGVPQAFVTRVLRQGVVVYDKDTA